MALEEIISLLDFPTKEDKELIKRELSSRTHKVLKPLFRKGLQASIEPNHKFGIIS